MKKLFAFSIVFALGTSTLFAQEITDEQFNKFATAFQAVQQESNQAQLKMTTVIEAEGLTMQRFNEIHQASLNPSQESDVTAKEKKQHQAAMAKLETMNQVLQAKMDSKIKEVGLTSEVYNKIKQKIQSDPAMQQKLMARFQTQNN
jgi:FtsP/CotA-like multicopper oxidase with cupredoxin domain